jgi:uncharacterized protein
VHFEWDEQKNRANIRKHGFDFADAYEIFAAPMLVWLDAGEDYDEERYIGMGFLKEHVVVVVFNERNSDTVRIISLRKALKHERLKFEEAIRNGLDAN